MDEIYFLKLMIQDLENHVKTLQQRLKKLTNDRIKLRQMAEASSGDKN